MNLIQILKAAFLGIVEGITEWLPVSSTGHLILIEKFMPLGVSAAFMEMFLVVIQLGAILAVIALYWRRLLPVTTGDKPQINRSALLVWGKVLVASIPAGIIGLLFEDQIDALFYNDLTVSIALIVYGVLFILIEGRQKHIPKIDDIERMPLNTALMTGLFQVLALIPGTSRSGATIVGAMLIGTSRAVAAEFTFFLAIPVMFGASMLKLLKFGLSFGAVEAAILLTGMLTAFVVSILAIRFLMGYIKNHSFAAFGWYRIALGAAILLYSLCT